MAEIVETPEGVFQLTVNAHPATGTPGNLPDYSGASEGDVLWINGSGNPEWDGTIFGDLADVTLAVGTRTGGGAVQAVTTATVADVKAKYLAGARTVQVQDPATVTIDLPGAPTDTTGRGFTLLLFGLDPTAMTWTANGSSGKVSRHGDFDLTGSDVYQWSVEPFDGGGGNFEWLLTPSTDGTSAGGSGPLDAEQFDRTSTTPGSISVDLSSVTKAGAAIFVDGASDVTITDLPASSDFPAFFVYVARITGTGVCTLTFDGGAPVFDGDQYTATSEANGQAAIGLVPLGSGENWLVDSVFPAAGGSGPDLSDADPEDLGTVDPGVSPDASRADHVHAMPTAADVGAATEAYADGKVADAINDGTTGVAPSQNAVFDALALKAPLASPALTGNPTAPTQTAGNNSTRLATTAYVDTAAALRLRRYRPPTASGAWQLPGSVMTSVGGFGSGVAKDNLILSGFFVAPVDLTITGMQMWWSSGGSAGALIRLGVFSFTAVDGTYTLINDAGTVSGASSGVKQLTGLSISIAAGTAVAGGWVHNATSSIVPVYRSFQPFGGTWWHGDETGGNAIYRNALKSFTYGSLASVSSVTVQYTNSITDLNSTHISYQWTE